MQDDENLETIFKLIMDKKNIQNLIDYQRDLESQKQKKVKKDHIEIKPQKKQNVIDLETINYK